MSRLSLRLERERIGTWRAGRGVSVSEAMRDLLEAEKVGTTFGGGEASREAERRRARELAKTAPLEEQDEEREVS